MQQINAANRIESTLIDLNYNQEDDELISPKISYSDQLKEMEEDSSITEQLNDLIHVCHLKAHGEEIRFNRILFFAFDIANKKELTISESRILIGKLIFLVNQNIDEVNILLKNKSNQEQRINIYEAFEKKLNAITASLLKCVEEHKQGLLHDPEKALSVRIPIELAKALISDSGFINIGIIEPLIKRFLSQRKMPFEKHIAYVLNAIRLSKLLRQKIHLIQSPFSQTMQANDIIRITLGLSKVIPTAIDAKKTALAALISHMRQSPANSCFASFLAIEILSKQPICSLDDFCELLQKNYLSRNVEGQLKEFSFLMRTGNESTSKKVWLDKTGKIYADKKLNCFLWQVPGIKAACKTLGIKKKQEFLTDISMELLVNQKIAEFSISKILKKIATHVEGDFEHNYYCAKLSFESQLHSPLLRIWENAIASMAEATGHGKLTEALVDSVVKSCSKLLGTNLVIKRELKQNFTKYLIEAAHYAYDTDIKNKQVSNDGRSERGAFILYNKCGSTSIKNWKRIEDTQDFRVFITDIMSRSFISFKEKEELLGPIKDFIKTDKFIIDCLHFYDIQNSSKSDIELIKNIKDLPHTPWKDKTGNNSNEVLRIYSNTLGLSQSIIFNSKNAYKLLISIIDMARKFSESIKKNLKENPGLLSPLIIQGQHALSMMFGHDSFKGVLKIERPTSTKTASMNTEKTIIEWINENLIVPGKKISDNKITPEMKKKIYFFITNATIEKNDKQAITNFHEKYNALPNEMTLSSFRNSIIDILKETLNEKIYSLKRSILEIDNCIFKHIIPKECRETLSKSAIHFADTNWGAGIHNIHFCFIFNPASAAIEIWEVYEDGTELQPICQNDWLKKPWEIYIP